MKRFWILIPAAAVLTTALSAGQKIETVDGIRIVHNTKIGKWGKTPQVTLVPIQTLGDVNAADEKTAFHMPANIVPDAGGNLYILDSGNHRIQKFSADGKYLATIGRQGQGPGEFYFPSWLDIDATGTLYVTDPNNQRVQVLTVEGKEQKTIKMIEGSLGNVFRTKTGELIMGPPTFRFMINPTEQGKSAELPKLIKRVDLGGKVLMEFGAPHDYKDELLNNTGNEVIFTADADGRVFLVFPMQNRIEKYSADGRLLWRADRPLNYSMDVLSKGKIERQGGRVSFNAPRINRCAGGIAVDGQGRVWVVTFNRQLKKEEQAGIQVTMSMTDGQRTMGYKASGNTELQTTDAYKLEVFDPDGVLLGEIPLTVFVDGIFIFGDRLFLMDKLRGSKFYEFKIKE
jgi:sugar lactone lactonase YvrE